MSYISLYRKYRSQTFDDVVGQDHVTQTLQNAISLGRIGHAYLFCGSRGTGKTSVARLLAKAVNCVNGPTPTPCNQCDACLSITDGSAVDVVELDAASNRGIDDIKEIRDNVKYPPMQLRYKVYVIDEAHQLSDAAKDAFLKTLEEPPTHAIFVLATTEAHEIPSTIRSRCQQFDFRRGSVADVAKRLRHVLDKEGREADDAAVDVLARNARGSWRDSLSLLEQVLSFTNERVTIEHVNTVLGTVDEDVLYDVSDVIAREDTAGAFELAGKLIHEGKDVRELVKAIAGHFRDLLAASVGACGPETSIKASERARNFSRDRLVSLIELFAAAERELRFNDQHRLALEMAFLKAICGPAQPQVVAQTTYSAPAPQPTRPTAPASAAPRPSAPVRRETPPPAAAKRPEQSSTDTAAPVEPVSPPIPMDGNVGVVRIRQAWPRVLRHIKDVQRQALLIGVLREAEVESVDGDIVHLSFDSKFRFHVEKVQSSANVDVVGKAFEAVLGRRFIIKAAIRDDAEAELPVADVYEEAPPPPIDAPATDMVQDVIDMFGGRVVESSDEVN